MMKLSSKSKLQKMVLISLFAAVMCIFAPFTIPIGLLPLSLSTFALYLTAIILGKSAVWSIVVYIIIGAVGLPVFSGGVGGFDRLLGPTGGFIIGYLPCAFISGLFADKFKDNKTMYFLGIFIGSILMYIPGILWMLYILGTQSMSSALSVLSINILPFIPIDFIKMFLAVFTGTVLRKRLKT